VRWVAWLLKGDEGRQHGLSHELVDFRRGRQNLGKIETWTNAKSKKTMHTAVYFILCTDHLRSEVIRRAERRVDPGDEFCVTSLAHRPPSPPRRLPNMTHCMEMMTVVLLQLSSILPQHRPNHNVEYTGRSRSFPFTL
jgi:hypothetical protein